MMLIQMKKSICCILLFNLTVLSVLWADCNHFRHGNWFTRWIGKETLESKIQDPQYRILKKEASQVFFYACVVPLSYASQAIDSLDRGYLEKELQFTTKRLVEAIEEGRDLLVTIIRMEHTGNFKILPDSFIKFTLKIMPTFQVSNILEYSEYLHVSNTDPINQPIKYWIVPFNSFFFEQTNKICEPNLLSFIKHCLIVEF